MRFTSIQYLPRESDAEPQRFQYSTRVAFGLKIDGEGESTGNREDGTGVRTSALKFWSNDAKSLIVEGSGYWQYIPVDGGTRFLTWYDYRTRFGLLGRALDIVVFRPLLGWATAWSFDRMRLWIEDGEKPAAAARLWTIHAVARLAICFTWLWHGLVPKLLFPQADERAMLVGAGIPAEWLPVVGMVEVAIAIGGVLSWRSRSYFLLNAAAMIAALAAVVVHSPSFVTGAFNPVTLNAGMVALSAIGYAAGADLPSASHCLRRPPGESR